MSGSATTFISARFLTPDYMVRALDASLSCPLWQDGALVAPSSGTCTVYNASNETVSSGAVTVTGSTATYTVAAADIPATLSPASGWRVEWALVVSGDTLTFRNTAALVLSVLYPAASEPDLYRRVSGLDPNGTKPIHSLADLQDYLDEAWVMILGRLINAGNLPYLVVEPTALREAHIDLTLSLIFEDFSTRLNEKHADAAERYRDRFDSAWAGLRFEYDFSQDGRAGSRRKVSAAGSMWMTSRG